MALRRQKSGTGTIYMQASDFVHPDHVEKQSISEPVAAAPMGPVDVTACDGVRTGAVLSADEARRLRHHARQTAHALGARHHHHHALLDKARGHKKAG
ncbi:hypothetical protein H4R18_004008 [Coemansia javaensis]|uniref:Uncharacterized protein n=1 Tax=Coemansia javaensis TaxID=2761396 RepID=A0A9W8LGV3_9FUNG|nr:hypothetical protein H4R18_004008 [Coemansia javaensis]